MSYGFANKQDTASAGSESADMPILCESCLGPNPYVRMSRIPYGGECKVCTRPFTIFRWSPASGARPKRTEICTTCAKLKNVCQTCVLDLQYALPVQVRDTAMGLAKQAPTGDINRQFFVNNVEAQGKGALALAGPSSGRAGQELLKKLTRTEPGYKRARTAQLCSFFAKGNCARGEACPYRHELPAAAAAAGSGAGTPTTKEAGAGAASMLITGIAAPGGAPLQPPADPSIATLFLTNLPDTATATEQPLRTFFHAATTTTPATDLSSSSSSSSIRSITLVPQKKCAFVNFASREEAERAAGGCRSKMVLEGAEVRVSWGRSRAGGKGAPAAGTSAATGSSAAA